ncbi:dienelactone hydrolase family protein [Lyngbya aestuarii]|uniref:dienelactone hydrolase family protein n=1 Tax=Lyngbya aestuarii TaxID=118322 RepID=UPI00403D77BA
MNTISEPNVKQIKVAVKVDSVTLAGSLEIPVNAKGIVLFAHSSSSSYYSLYNHHLAQILHQRQLATLLLDLLSLSEKAADRQARQLRFDLGLLAGRLVGTTDWLLKNPITHNLRIGYFGTSTGSSAALLAAVERPDAVSAIVSHRGRPDLAGAVLSRVKVPTLLIVGEHDLPLLERNRAALRHLRTPKQLEIIPGAAQCFEEPGTLEKVAHLASQWFEDNFLSSCQPNQHPLENIS